jgi:hypothetical protein
MSVFKFILHVWEFLYPPYGLSRFNPSDAAHSPAVNRTSSKSRKSILPDIQQGHLIAAEAIYKSEIDRKKAIEDKAAIFLASVAISSSILIALPALLTDRIGGPISLKMAMLSLFVVAVGYLIIAATFAVKARASAPLYVINSTSLQSFELTGTDFRRQWAAHLIDLARRNEPLLILKANQLALAEHTFLRGVLIATFAGFLLGILSIVYPKTQNNSILTNDSIEKKSVAGLMASVVGCTNSNAGLALQLAAEGKARMKIEAELAAALEANAKLAAKFSTKRKFKYQHQVLPALSAPLMPVTQECAPNPTPSVQKQPVSS